MTKKTNFSTRAALCLALACLAGPAHAGPTDVSNVPLATSGGRSILPNLLFDLDDSGSMAWTFMPDYVSPNTNGTALANSRPCMVDTQKGSTSGGQFCYDGDPPYAAGGQLGFNGVGYDPNFRYKPGVGANGSPLLNPPGGLPLGPAPISTTKVVADTYAKVSNQSPATVDLSANIPDVTYCNVNGACKRPGADPSTNAIISGKSFDSAGSAGITMTAGQFPYRTNPSNSSTAIFGLPETMSIGALSRSGTTVTVTTVEAHGLTSSDMIYVTSGTTSMNVTCAAISVTNANAFTYTTSTSGTTSVTGSYRKCVAGSWTRSSSTVTVSTTGSPGLVVGDSITVAPASSFTAGVVTVTAVGATSFQYTSSTGTGTIAGFWVRTGLYNRGSTTTGPAISYQIIPVEYCSDVNLTNCTYVIPGNTAPAGFTFPAHVRFCQTLDQALANGAVGDASGTPRCRSKYNESSVATLYEFPRYGWFQRDTIVKVTGLTFVRSSARTDCAAPTTTGCIYDEEMNNYAMWYTYYRTRLQMMKSAVGIAFVPFIGSPSTSPPKPNSIRLGFITMHAQDCSGCNGSVSTTGNKYLRIQDFDTTQATNFYSKFYANTAGNGTPLQEALARAGWIYAGKLNTGLTAGIPTTDDPIQAACQRNYTLLTTDGFWNGSSSNPPLTLGGRNVGNLDPKPATLNGSVLVDRTLTTTLDGTGSTSTTVTPQGTKSEQVVCQGSNTANFPNIGGSTGCGCGPKQHALIEQDITTVVTQNFQNGVPQGGGTTTTNQTFTTVQGCTDGTWQETDTPQTIVEDQVCVRNATVTFSDGSQYTCSCAKSRSAIVRQTTTQQQTVITVDGFQTTSGPTQVSRVLTFSAGSGFSSNFPGTCFNGTTPPGVQNPNPQTTTGTATTTGATNPPLAFTLVPNPQNVTGGVQTSTFSGAGTANTVADTALYYYQTPLRGSKDLYGDNTGPATGPNTIPPNTVNLSTSSIPVKAGAKDFVAYQHMVTFGIGLADGFMRFQPDYATASSGDYFNITNGTLGACFWTAGDCNWPAPADNTSANLDDLWHAAVNGRGNYFQALNANALSQGLSTVLTSVNAQVASASASATSSPNVTQTDNQIFSTTYETNTWSGSVFAQKIDPITGNVNPTIQWQADGQLVTKANADARRIFTFDPSTGNSTKVQDFRFATLDVNAQPFFTNLCGTATAANPPASQMHFTNCATGGIDVNPIADDGNQVVNFLRGDASNEGTVFHDRQLIDPVTGAITQTVLGDTVNAKPVFVRNPILGYTDAVTPGYSTFALNNVNRAPRVYVAANDGFLHAFDGNTGDESWAYAPRFILPNVYKLADFNYGNNHRFFVDGSPETFDVFDTSAFAWKTILIGGAGGGGRGFYALDVTDPVNPKGLWEFCVDPTMCAINDPDLGFAWGNPVVGKRSSDGRWVVVLTSGLNNVPNVTTPTPIDFGGTTGSGIGVFYVLDAITGAILNKVSTNVGSVASPSGLMKQSAFYTSAFSDATMRYIYAGDQLGNLWRLDLGPTGGGTCDAPAIGSAPCVSHVAQLTDGSSPLRAQPITTRPQLTLVNSNTTRVIFVGTGRYLGDGLHNGTSDLSDAGTASGIAWLQTMYAIKDRNFDYGTGFRSSAAVVKQTLSLTGTSDRNVTKNPVDFSTNDGWMVDFIALTDDPAGGERVNIDPRLVLGTLVVVTNTPAGGGSCSVGGSSRQYNFDYLTGGYVGNIQTPVGLSLGGTIAVGMAIVQLPSSSLKDIITGADTSKTTSNVPSNFGTNSLKRFSYRER
jgi:type IV pilus assembly protein PilY1